MKETYYGYEPVNTTDWDYNSWMGIGDRNNDLTPGYSVALSEQARQEIFGTMSRYSTGKEFQWNGKTYRDDDTSPQPFANIDIYSPGGVPGTPSYNSAQVTPLGKSSGQSLAGSSASLSSQVAQQPAEESATQQGQSRSSIIDQFRKAYPQHANVDFSKIMEKVQAIHPTIEPTRLEELLTKSNSWQELANASKQSNASYQNSFSSLKKLFEGDSGGGSDSES